ncbi:hypothetical protein [Nocardia terpenica]|uniref:Uncharacterized protein n=1 Tax=Nocardia terpenica TaxID=455432 RepID=A0A6G9Z5S7_9NOCA|nr:hypothetical protein [Nocardia terpenica]QIS20949.1 hypothetical protein F6W96_24155 [Nocardia terpenica]
MTPTAMEGTEIRRADEALPIAALACGADITPVGADTAPVDGVGVLLRHR